MRRTRAEKDRERARTAKKTGEKKWRASMRNRTSSPKRCKSVSAYDRVRQFPNQTLFVEKGKLFCEPYGRKPICLMKITGRITAQAPNTWTPFWNSKIPVKRNR